MLSCAKIQQDAHGTCKICNSTRSSVDDDLVWSKCSMAWKSDGVQKRMHDIRGTIE